MADTQQHIPDASHGEENLREEMPYGVIPTEQLLDRYSKGWFPMSYTPQNANNEMKMAWFNYSPRGVLPLDRFKIPHGSKALIRDHPYHVTVDQDFEGVIRGCAAITDKPDRDGTWINEEIIQSYVALHKHGNAHSIEIRDQNGTLVGGLYGVSIGGVFCGESMFSTVPGASKIALVELVAILKKAGYSLLDVQEVGALTGQFGAVDIPRAEYAPQLAAALAQQPDASKAFAEVAKAHVEAPASGAKRQAGIAQIVKNDGNSNRRGSSGWEL